ncbi:hypothetical protein FA95DRAFT_1566978 [Auriscalpium vulgare]|uniref:Uncharacterized protein n=1 Tax=Auriscalpium vulgare TaxID=40419 RepID=A0ACB8R802_9AGAM|nr:hypothetical protein FA95DRAFT_1566978 [Auriscalpium vulgare]
MCRNCNWVEYDTHDLASFKALARSARRIDFSSLSCAVQPHVKWIMTMADWGAVDESGKEVFGEDAAGAQHRYGLMCKAHWDIYDGARFVQSFIGDRPPSADVVLDFVRVCITISAPAQLPGSLRLTPALLPYAAKLKPFLAALPAPFSYFFETRAHAHENAVYFFECAETCKLQGNARYARRERAEAVEAYAEAADILEHVLTMGHAEHDMHKAKKLRAVYFANSAAAHLLDGPGQDAQQALSDGVQAERSDPEYAKGYLRQMRAHVLLGDDGAARQALERAAKRVHGADVQVITDALDKLIVGD